MGKKISNTESARKWFLQALHDIELAEKNLKIKGYDVSAFLSHQAIEKLLKGIIILQKGKAPKTHYIDELANILNLPKKIRKKVLSLAGDYMIARYPDVTNTIPYEEYTYEIA